MNTDLDVWDTVDYLLQTTIYHYLWENFHLKGASVIICHRLLILRCKEIDFKLPADLWIIMEEENIRQAL